MKRAVILLLLTLMALLGVGFAQQTLSISASVTSGTAPTAVTFVATASGFTGTAFASVWSFGDGTYATHILSATHTYANPGTYQAFVVYVDMYGHTGYGLSPVVDVAAQPAPVVGYCGADGTWQGPRFDQSAELPRTCFNTNMTDTPSVGAIIHIPPTATLEKDINAAVCGQTLELVAGATYSLNGGSLTPKKCTNDKWVIIRSDALDSALPPEHTRINPSYAGVASLPGRPAFSGGTGNVMPKVLITNGGGIDLGDHIRLLGVEVTRGVPAGKIQYALLRMWSPYVVIDRSWVHGDPIAETTRGLQTFVGMDHGAVIDSYFSDFHCTAVTGACTDAQAIAGVSGGVTLKIDNNFLEAAAETILFGGGAGTIVTTDVQITHNHLFKPLTWNPLSPNFIGTKFVVKNLLEMKQVKRLFVEGNVMENTWGGYSQNGSAILLTPKNQGGTFPNAEDSDIVMRFNYITHVGTAWQIGYGPSDSGAWPVGAHNYSLHDFIVDGIQYPGCYACGSYSVAIGTGADPADTTRVMHDVWLDHMTLLFYHNTPAVLSWLSLSGPPATAPQQMYNIKLTNFVAETGQYLAYGSGGGAGNCFISGALNYTLELPKCWKGDSLFDHNLVSTELQPIKDRSGHPIPWVMPAGNTYIPTITNIFAAYAPEGGDYHLTQYKNSAADGKDPGADIDAVMEHIAGVR